MYVIKLFIVWCMRFLSGKKHAAVFLGWFRGKDVDKDDISVKNLLSHS